MMPLIRELRQRSGIQTVVLSTGQHGDLLAPIYQYFDVFPEYDLHLMRPGQSLNELSASVLQAADPILQKEVPDLVLVHGDTATAFAVTLACYYRQIPVGHVEAGLRTHRMDSPFPEEFYRRAADAMATYHFAPTGTAVQNLLKEGKDPARVFCTGNTIVDAMQYRKADGEPSGLPEEAGDAPIILLTAHRRENLGEPMTRMFRAVRRVMEEHPAYRLVYPVHPNPEVRAAAHRAFDGCNNILLVPPYEYAAFRQLEQSCYLCLTDSGGVQEECSAIGKPVLVLRDVTERTEGIAEGPLQLAGTSEEKVYSAFSELLNSREAYLRACRATQVYGDGRTSRRIADIITQIIH